MKNKIIVDEKNVGKTTFLLSEIARLKSEGIGIIILDSATEHEEKSLLRKTNHIYDDTIVIDPREADKVILNKIGIDEFVKNFMNYFPFAEIFNNRDKTICFDLSYFLELGHDVYDETHDMKQYKYYRELYNNLSEQIILVLILMEKYGIISNKVVVMDEIELPITNYDLYSLQDNIGFIASVHPENAFGSFYQSFEKANFKPYVKKKG